MITLKQWMEQKELNNSELAEILGVSYQTIYKMAEGLRPVSGGVKYRIAREFGIDVAERLAHSADDPEPEPEPEPAQ